VLRRSRRNLYERLLDEKDTQLRILGAEIEWLRAQLGAHSFGPVIPQKLTLPDDAPSELSAATWESEEEEAQMILDSHGLSAIHLPEILDGLGYGNSDLS
jgi:hypothetical protein